MAGANTNLGELTRVELRDVWKSEPKDFTPWLTDDANLVSLGKALGIELEFEAMEKDVGPFRADILCKEQVTGTWVLIENQLKRTDHTHLGQLLTYASGLGAVTIVWIAKEFTEEHRSTLDWLNKITDEGIKFFGLEIELWQIGESLAAPKWNIVSKPNDWSRSVSKAAKAINGTTSETKARQHFYWTKFHEFLRERGDKERGSRAAQPQSWMDYSIGRTEFRVCAYINSSLELCKVYIYISGMNAKAFFHLLHQKMGDAKDADGDLLDWEELPKGQDCRISVYLRNADPKDEGDWSRQHEWLARKIQEFDDMFRLRIRSLDPSDWDSQSE